MIERPVSAVPELAAVLLAIRRGAHRSEFRTLDVACQSSHRLLEVFTTAAGPVVYARGRHGTGQPAESSTAYRDSRSEFKAVRLAEAPDDYDIFVQCRCREELIPVRWIVEQLAAGRRRVVW